MGNGLKTTLFLAILTGLFIAVGSSLGGQSGAIMAFGIAILMNFGSYWFSDTIVLKRHRAQVIDSASHPDLVAMVERLAHRAGLPMPKVYIMPDMSLNAFATGRNPSHAAVAFTQGIINQLNPDELAGVAAHELAHIQNRDILISSIAACVGGAISMLANMAQWAMLFGRDREEGQNPVGALVTIIVAPIAAMLIQMAISRSREYLADARGAEIHGNPLDLASALAKLHNNMALMPPSDQNPAMAHMYIMSPLTGGQFMNLFSTHPPVEARIARLRALAKHPGDH